MSIYSQFKLSNMLCVITGGTGMLGLRHAKAVLDVGGIPVLLDLKPNMKLVDEFFPPRGGFEVLVVQADVSDEKQVIEARDVITSSYKHLQINGLINNAANNRNGSADGRLESFSELSWDNDIDVGLKGAFICSKVFGSQMAERKNGVIVNVASDLGLIAPDQRIYRQDGVEEAKQPVKPVTYSVVKHGLIGLTKYLATYWATSGVRVNAICPGGVHNDHDPEFVKKLTNLIPMGRMADKDEYQAAIVFLLSSASSYMTGASLVMDGGRTCW